MSRRALLLAGGAAAAVLVAVAVVVGARAAISYREWQAAYIFSGVGISSPSRRSIRWCL